MCAYVKDCLVCQPIIVVHCCIIICRAIVCKSSANFMSPYYFSMYDDAAADTSTIGSYDPDDDYDDDH